MPGVHLDVRAGRVTPTRVRVRARIVNEDARAWRHSLPTSERVRVTAAAGARTVFASNAGRFFLQVLTPLEVAAGGALELDEESFDAPREVLVVTARVPGTHLTASTRV